ncbi:hypothetical protein [Breoghania sp.]|uniref:hypothetical protein n=1 Tax=Breoghania sp. TaxID=2065378 RepID=UPI002AA90106|nr:hypothetical protein [Breoghania sp.]
MAKVRATQRGYFGGRRRDFGEEFEISDKILKDKKLRPSWVEEVKATKASAAKAPEPTSAQDNPEPVRVKNEINEAIGGTAPDWVMPSI